VFTLYVDVAQKSMGETVRNHAAIRKGCRFYMCVAWSKENKHYAVKSCDLQHNHDISADTYPLYAASR